MGNNNYYILIHLEAAGDPGHEGEAEEDGQQEEEEEVEPHVGRGVRLQRDYAVLAPGKRGAQVLNSGVIRLYTLLFYRQKQTVDLHSVLLSKQLTLKGMLLPDKLM